MRRPILVFLAAIMMAGCASTREPLFGQTQQRLQRIGPVGPAGGYSLAKAQCWLDSAWVQYNENDRTGYVEHAIAEAGRIAQALEADRNTAAGMETPIPASSTRVREDLWARVAGFRAKTAASSCAATTVACAEVRLVRAGHAFVQTGWRGAGVHVAMAEDAIERARAQEAQCPPAAAAASPAAPVAALAPVQAAVMPPAPTPAPQTFTFLADALFRFDKSGLKDILPEGAQRLKELADKLKPHPSIRSVRIEGHTDRLGSPAYNDALSQARADAVKAFFVAEGAKAVSMEAKGMGERAPVTRDCSDKLPREKLVQCLQPDRRVTVEVNGPAP